MPRHGRERSIDGIYHLMVRGINRQNIFEDDEDKRRFIETIANYKPVSGYFVYGYCLMSNHIHLLLKETNESISDALKRISSSYVYWYNHKYERCGHLFQERYKSEAVDTERYFLTVLRYIHQNPVNAGMIEDVSKYPWSSYHEYTGKPKLADVDFVLNIYSPDRVKAVKLFEDFNNEKNEDQCLDYKYVMSICDKEVIAHLEKLGIKNAMELQSIEREKRNTFIKHIKNIEGVSLRQLSRITGLSKSVIERI